MDEFLDQQHRISAAIRDATITMLQGDVTVVATGLIERLAPMLDFRARIEPDGTEVGEVAEVVQNVEGQFTQRVPKYKFYVRVHGDLAIFGYRPSAGPSYYPAATVTPSPGPSDEGTLVFEYVTAQGAQAAKRQLDADLETIQNGLANFIAAMQQQKIKLVNMATAAIPQRVATHAVYRKDVEALGLPIRRAGGAL
jgi:hypothetical protein